MKAIIITPQENMNNENNARLIWMIGSYPGHRFRKSHDATMHSKLNIPLFLLMVTVFCASCSKDTASSSSPPQLASQVTPAVPSKDNTGGGHSLSKSIAQYAESLASGKLDEFFSSNPFYMNELIKLQQALPQSEWGNAIPPVQDKWSKFMQATVGQIPDNPMFETWAYQPDCGTSVFVTELRPDSSVKNGHIAFVRFEYSNPSNSPVFMGRRLSQITLRCSIVSEDNMFAVIRNEPVSTLIAYHQIPDLTTNQAETLLSQYLKQSSAPKIVFPTDKLDRGRRGTIRASSNLSDEIVKPAGRKFTEKSASFGVTVTQLALGEKAGGWGGSDGCYSLQFPPSWNKYGGPSEFALYDTLSLSILAVSRIGESECRVNYSYQWAGNEIAMWCKTTVAPFYNTLEWGYPRWESGQIQIMNVGDDFDSRLLLAGLSEKTNDIIFVWSTPNNEWKCSESN